ncbi:MULTISPECIES: dTDP-4-dehydrorhamnose reductase [unclassified Agrococcus]|uniref:dTDP-4-dehydrorhamnose reductase n=1 Tax=unclassified Agrococcus TaxID=2615065 RepID=UPI00361DD730
MRILLVGANGMLGQDLRAALAHHDVVAVGSRELDVRDAAACLAAADGVDAIVNASAYTAVDQAESDEDAAYAVNADGPANLAAAAAANGAVLVHVSTDYVFRGDATEPYAEDTPVDPVSAYGRTKAAGEARALAANADTIVVRTAWLYGPGGGSFASTMVRLAGERETLTVVDDQRGQPTTTHDLASRIAALLDGGVRSGIFHGTSSGETTWFGFARAIFEELGLDPERVQPTDSTAFARPAPRPAYSVLGHDAWTRAGIEPIGDWRAALAAAVARGELAA